ncbi:MAG: MFS transporter [Planctomycetota bacterium]|nr:MFS transporter [Planctomycetota bacterium]
MPASAWVLYDLANTIYIATGTYRFTPYVTERFEHRIGVGITQTLSMVLCAALLVGLGALADRTARTRSYLAISTILCVAAMAGWGLGGEEFWLLACFFVANVAYNTCLLFYNSLLASVAPENKVGLLSGIGVGVGYLGTLLVLAVLILLVPSDTPAEHKLLYAALGFFVLSLPCMLLVADRRKAVSPATAAASPSAWSSLATAIRSLPQHRPLMFFLLANFCLVDVLNTAILFFADFTTDLFQEQARTEGLFLLGSHYTGEDGLQHFMAHMGMGLNVMALLFGIGLGLLTDRRPLLVMRISAGALLVALIGGAVFGGVSPLGYSLTLVTLGAFALSGTWTAGRKIILLLAPADRIGEFFGLYGMTLKLSVIGSTTYAVIRDHSTPQAAILSQSLLLLLGVIFLAMVRLPTGNKASGA